jgi:hypothetical protein
MPNPVVHFEITGRDEVALGKFYAEAFGWRLNPVPNYTMVDSDGEGIDGGIGRGDPPVATFYIEVDDPAAYLRKVEELGGKVVQDVTVIPGSVTIARFLDPAGNVIGLVKAE